MLKLLALLFSGAKLGKLLATGGSMLLSVVVYGWLFGWRYAVSFVALLFTHELGHYWAARHKGLGAGLPTFIPFFGAWVEMKKLPHDAQTEAFVGLAGPLLGTAGAMVAYLMARSWQADWLLAAAYGGFMLNLINLIPVVPFDGGRITAVLSPRVWLLGAPMLVALFLWRPNPMLILMAVLAWPQLVKAWRYRSDSAEAQDYYEVPAAVKWEYGSIYLALAAYLAVMAHDVHEMLGRAQG